MLGKTYDTQACSAARALEAVGERWSLLIVRDVLFAGATRFADFQRLGIATNILAIRLDSLVDSGILERHPSPEHPDRWAAPDGPPVLYRHTDCGAAVTEQTTCATCGHIADLTEIHVVHGPGMPPR